MDPALTKETDDLKEKKLPSKAAKKKVNRGKSVAVNDCKASSSSSSSNVEVVEESNVELDAMPNRFKVIAQVVRYMRSKHQQGNNVPLTLDEILHESKQFDVSDAMKTWLLKKALVNNPKLQVVEGDRFVFKPVYKISDAKGLMRLLKKHHQKGLGGIFLEDIEESLPNASKILKSRADEITTIVRPEDKRKVLFYNDRSVHLEIEEKFKNLWRATSVCNMVDSKIEEYLENRGMASMRNCATKEKCVPPNGKKKRKH